MGLVAQRSFRRHAVHPSSAGDSSNPPRVRLRSQEGYDWDFVVQKIFVRRRRMDRGSRDTRQSFRTDGSRGTVLCRDLVKVKEVTIWLGMGNDHHLFDERRLRERAREGGRR